MINEGISHQFTVTTLVMYKLLPLIKLHNAPSYIYKLARRKALPLTQLHGTMATQCTRHLNNDQYVQHAPTCTILYHLMVHYANIAVNWNGGLTGKQADFIADLFADCGGTKCYFSDVIFQIRRRGTEKYKIVALVNNTDQNNTKNSHYLANKSDIETVKSMKCE